MSDLACECITGAVKVRERDDIFRRFQSEGKPNVLFADPGTMSHGLDLFLLVSWHGTDLRIELRSTCRQTEGLIAQDKKFIQQLYDLASTPVEREIYRRLSTKQNMQGLILDLAKGGTNDF